MPAAGFQFVQAQEVPDLLPLSHGTTIDCCMKVSEPRKQKDPDTGSTITAAGALTSPVGDFTPLVV